MLSQAIEKGAKLCQAFALVGTSDEDTVDINMDTYRSPTHLTRKALKSLDGVPESKRHVENLEDSKGRDDSCLAKYLLTSRNSCDILDV